MIAARLPAIFGIAGFPALWVSLSLAGLAASISQIALSWTTLELTASPVGVALTLAVRMVPSLLLGIPLGAVSDRVDRRRLIRTANLVAGGVGLLVAGLAFGGLLGVPAIVAFSFVFGIIDTARTTATQAYVYDLVGPDRATNGLAMSNLGAQLFGSAGAILGGVLIAAGGLGSGFGVATACWLVGAIVLGRTHAPGSVVVDRLTPSARSALTLLGRNREVRWILAMVIVTEVLGFSSMTLTPTFARDVLDVGAAGLGVLVGGSIDRGRRRAAPAGARRRGDPDGPAAARPRRGVRAAARRLRPERALPGLARGHVRHRGGRRRGGHARPDAPPARDRRP